jgi:diacylglycerol O-acyltransferase
MKRLSGADAFMLAMETSRAYMHTFKIAIIDPSTDPDGWSFEKYFKDAESRVHTVPMFRWKVVDAPLGLQYWVDDPDFDLHYHLRRVACPPPADHRALCEFMSAVYSYQLDRDRPLWMQWVVEGLEGGRVALVMMVHHAYVDGVGAAWLLQQFYQPRAGVTPASIPEWHPAPLPSYLTRLGWALRDLPAVLLGNLPKAVLGIMRKIRLERSLARAGKPHPSAAMMPLTPINRVVSAGRTFVCDTLPLEKFKRVSKGMDYTINDVFSTCAAGAVRRLLQDVGHDVDAAPLVAGTPFGGKRPEGMEGLGNYATADFSWLHSEIADPRERIAAMHAANDAMKGHLKAVRDAGADINAVIQILPPWAVKFLRRAIHRQQGRVGFFGNLALSNVPGPKESLYLDHWKVTNWFSTGMIMDGTTLNMTMWTYAGEVSLCMMIDRAVLADGWILFNYFVEELDALAALVPPDAVPQESA